MPRFINILDTNLLALFKLVFNYLNCFHDFNYYFYLKINEKVINKQENNLHGTNKFASKISTLLGTLKVLIIRKKVSHVKNVSQHFVL